MSDPNQNQHAKAAFGAAALLINDALRGDAHAAVALTELAARLCDAVDDLPLQMAHEIAARRATWPGLLGAHPAALSDAKAKLRTLGLGRLHRHAKTLGIPTGPKRVRLDSPAQAISIECHDAVVRLVRRATDKVNANEPLTTDEAEAYALPPLSKSAFGLWFGLGWRKWREACTSEKNGRIVFQSQAAHTLAGAARVAEPNRTALKTVERAVRQASRWWVE